MQQLMEDRAGNVWEVDANGEVKRLVQRAPRTASPATITTQRDPFEVVRDRRTGAQADATLRRTEQQIQRDAATADADRRKAIADANAAEANATIARAKAAEAGAAGGSINPAMDRLTGASYLSKLPMETQAQVMALSDGRLAFPSGAALRSPYWQQMLQHVAHYDPQFDAINYNSRAATRRDFVAGKSAQNIRALNTAIGHLGQLNSQIGGTASRNFTPYNALSNMAADTFGAVGPGLFNQTASALASELTQVFRGSGGAEADIKRELEHLTPNGSLAQKQAAVRNIAGLLKSRLDSLGDQYQQGVGTTGDPIQMLNPHAKEAYGVLSGLTGDGGNSGGNSPNGPIQRQSHSFSPTNVIDFAAGLNGGKYKFIEGGGLSYNGKEVPVSETIANSEPYREAYRAQFGSYPPITVDVVGGELTPGAQSALDQQRDTFGGGVDALVRGGADTLSIGLADPFAAMMNTLTGGGTFADNLIRQRGVSAADERVNPGLRMTGQVAGSILPFMGASRLGAAALPSRPMLGAGIADTGLGAFYGGASNDKDRLTGAAVGGAAALAGNQFGQRVLAPAFRGVAGSQFGQRFGRGVAAAFDRPFVPPPVRPTAVDRTIAGSANANIDLIRSTLDDAERLGLPMSLADTSPQLRTLAGSAVRRSPDARAFAEQALTPRSLGEGGRAIQAIRRDFGPAVNMRDERDSILGAGRAASAPLYDQSYGAPIVSTPELDAVLNTPFGQQAISRARTIAANERRDPTGAGFSLDADGNPVLNPIPINLYQRQAEARSAFDAAREAHRIALRTQGADTNATRQTLFAAREAMQIADRALGSAPAAGTAATQRGYTTQTLDYAKRGMDDILESQRDPITGRLNLDEAGRAQNGVRGQLLTEMDQYNPFYRDARSTYQGYARQADALTSGYNATRLSVGVDDLNTMTARLGPAEQARFGQGYSTGLTERIEKQAFTGNPYNAIAGSSDDQAKLSALFPEGTPNFLRQGDLERQMGLTKYETIGGSPTAGRAQADRLLDPAFGVQALAETGLSMATGVPPIGAMAGAVRRGLGERFNVTMGQKKATTIAPRLLAPDPAQARAELDAMVQANDAYSTYSRRTNRLLGMFGRGFGLPVGTTFLAD